MTALKLIFMGTPAFALPTLKATVEAGHQVLAVYTQPPRPAGRGQKETLSPVHQYALTKGLPVYTPETLRTEETQKQFAAHHADAAVVAAYGLLLPRPILEAPKMGCINIHPSLLPRWRGAAPIQRTIMAGDKETGVVIMRMDVGLDTGDMYMTQKFSIPDGMTATALHDTLSEMAAPMVLQTLEGLTKGSITRTLQPDEGVTYAHKVTRDDGIIDWNESAEAIRQKILALTPHPGASFRYHEEVIKILNAEIVPYAATGKNGTVIDNHLTIQCAKNALRPTLIQRPGKKPMTPEEMLRGFTIAEGTVLGGYDTL
jgi:methionyl-tRNA formyltransferase